MQQWILTLSFFGVWPRNYGAFENNKISHVKQMLQENECAIDDDNLGEDVDYYTCLFSSKNSITKLQDLVIEALGSDRTEYVHWTISEYDNYDDDNN